MSGEAKGVWVYGVVPADASLETLERAGDKLPEVWLLEDGGLAAIVSEPPEEDETATRDRVLAHAHVLEAAVRDAPVIPMRFGIVCSGESEVVSDLLEERRDAFHEALEKVEQRVEMTLKAYYAEEALLREILAAEPEIERLREATRGGSEEATYNDRVRLGELVTKAIEQRRQSDCAEIVEQLKPITVAGVIDAPEKEMMVVNAAVLVERQQLQRFEAAVEDVAQERAERMQFKLLGPLPAYHFVDGEEPAWG
jgi:Gas vesicle synthesis protein GvpL/GvpF